MILLDTNILSELLRQKPDDGVVSWLASQPRASLFTTTIVRAELLYGIHLLPDGRRKSGLMEAATGIFEEDMAQQVLSFDSSAADAYAEIAATRKLIGKPISQFDAMIAGIARSRGALLATRNVKDFEGCGIEIANPFDC